MPRIESVCMPFSFEPPAGFAPEETTVTLRGSGGAVSPNLVVNIKAARPQATLTELSTEVVSELVQTIPELQALTTADITFADGGTGALLAYNMPISPATTLRQYHALRLEGAQLFSMTLTVGLEGLTEELGNAYVKSLASVRHAAVEA